MRQHIDPGFQSRQVRAPRGQARRSSHRALQPPSLPAPTIVLREVDNELRRNVCQFHTRQGLDLMKAIRSPSKPRVMRSSSCSRLLGSA